MSNEYYPEPMIMEIKGLLSWPDLVTTNTKYNSEGEWTANVVLPADEAQPYIDKIDAFFEESLQGFRDAGVLKAKAKVKESTRGYSEQMDSETGEPTGNIIFKASRQCKGVTKKDVAWKLTVPLFDSKGKPITGLESIYGGTEAIVRVALTPFYTASLGFGLSSSGKVPPSIKKGLLAVQIINLVQGGAGEESFGEVEGGYEHAVNPSTGNEEDDDAFEEHSVEDTDASETY